MAFLSPFWLFWKLKRKIQSMVDKKKGKIKWTEEKSCYLVTTSAFTVLFAYQINPPTSRNYIDYENNFHN